MKLQKIIEKIVDGIIELWLPQVLAAVVLVVSCVWKTGQDWAKRNLQEALLPLAGLSLCLALILAGVGLRHWRNRRFKLMGGYLWDREGNPYCTVHRTPLVRWKDSGHMYETCPKCGGHPAAFANDAGKEIVREEAVKMAVAKFH
jgi:hypothetical protein